jgi:hypothetical protein
MSHSSGGLFEIAIKQHKLHMGCNFEFKHNSKDLNWHQDKQHYKDITDIKIDMTTKTYTNIKINMTTKT